MVVWQGVDGLLGLTGIWHSIPGRFALSFRQRFETDA